MDEATNILLSKIKCIDPENASKIMGYILIQDLSERDLLRLAVGHETLLHTVILKAKTQLGLSSNNLFTSSTPSSPSLPNPIARSHSSSNPFSQSSPRVAPNGSFVDFGKQSSPHSWLVPGLPNNKNSISPKSSPFLSYDNIRSGSALAPSFSKNGGNGGVDLSNKSDFDRPLDDYFSFLEDSSSKNEEFVDPRVQLRAYSVNNGDSHLHRRRFSESDVCFGTEDGVLGVGYGPCMYFARGFCKNGDNCKFAHGDFSGDDLVEANAGGFTVGSPGEMEGIFLQQQQHEEMMRLKAAQQQQRLAYNKYMNFLLQQQNDPQRLGAAAMMMGDEFHRFGRFCSERNDFLAMEMAEKAHSASRQIYLTFPAESTFKDEDVSNYFSTFGPVQDVRIPFQQKRMFGFVTFVHPETVKLILARGNPHFICDSRVLVKPYKEKGKVATNRRQQHLQQQLLERGNFSPCSSPSGLDSTELFGLHVGTKMLYNTQDMMLRRKFEEQAELQQAIELQGRRLINLQLPDIRGDYIRHHQRSLSVGAPISLATHTPVDQNLSLISNEKNQEALEDNGDGLFAADNGDSLFSALSSTINVADQHVQHEIEKNGTSNGSDETFSPEESDVHECFFVSDGGTLEHILPNSLFASPIKSSGTKHHTELCVTSSSQNDISVFTSSGMASH